MATMDRREFVRIGALGAVGAALAACSEPLGPGDSPGALPGRRPSKRVVVVGAGLSGLVAAYELARAGHDVTVLEARTRVGGRILTLRAPFSNGHSAEAAAARVPPDHDLVLAYARHFGLGLVPFYPPDGLFVELSAGVRTTVTASAFRAARPDYVKLRGGSDHLPLAFAEGFGAVAAPRRAGRAVQLGRAVTRVVQTPATVRVSAVGGADTEADRALVTVPLPVLERIDFDPPLSAEKREAAAGGFDYRPATRVYVRFAQRPWEADGLNGWGVTDLPEEIWHPTWDAPGPEGVLMTYVRGERAREIDVLDGSQRVAAAVERFETLFPGSRVHALSGVAHSWQDEEWTRAAWAEPTPEQDARLGPHVGTAEGRVHFAGEHASGARGWMQGAIASGLRAAREIHEA